VAFVLIFLFVPETKLKTLEELDGVCKFLAELVKESDYLRLLPLS